MHARPHMGIRIGSLAVAAGLSLTTVAFGQADQVLSPANVGEDTVADNTPPSPPPGEDVMQPTQHAIRLTPRMADALARAWIHEFMEKDRLFVLTEEQKSAISGSVADRMMQLGQTHGDELSRFLECAVESIRYSQVPAEFAPEFAERAKAALPAIRKLFGDVPDEFREALSDQQLGEVGRFQEKVRASLDRFEARMNDWSQGAIRESGRPFQELRDPEGNAPRRPDQTDIERIRRAEATRDVARLGSEEWKRFLISAAALLGFDQEQLAQGVQLLAEYRDEATAIMTPQWKERVENNRYKHRVCTYMRTDPNRRDRPTGPALYHLDREYKALIEPIEELGRRFRHDVMALATADQLQAALRKLEDLALSHGMTDDEIRLDAFRERWRATSN